MTVELPLCASAAPVNVDIIDSHLVLDCADPGPYHLSVRLFYPIVEEKIAAVFDRSARKLMLTLPVAPLPPSAAELGVGVGGGVSGGEVDAGEAGKAEEGSVGEAATATTTTTAVAATTSTAAAPAIKTSSAPTPHLHAQQDESSVTVVVEVAGVAADSVTRELVAETFGPVTTHTALVRFTAPQGTLALTLK